MMDRDYEQEASAQGWNPDKDSVPEGKTWVDAQTFVEKGEKITGILKSRLDRQEVQIDRLQRTNAEFGKYKDAQQTKLKQENESLLNQLEEKRATAITEGDGTTFTQVDREIQNLRTQPQQSNPDADAWLINNNWYNTDSDLSAYADGVADRIISEGYTGPAYWNELTRRVKEFAPEKFSNPNREKSNSVESGSNSESKDRQAKSYENLPDDAKAACDAFVTNGLTSKEDYVTNYEW